MADETIFDYVPFDGYVASKSDGGYLLSPEQCDRLKLNEYAATNGHPVVVTITLSKAEDKCVCALSEVVNDKHS